MMSRLAFAATTVAFLGIATFANAETTEPTLFLRGAAYPESVLSPEPPEAEQLTNLDRGRNTDPGLTLESGGSGRREFDDARFQDFLTPADGMTVVGPVSLTLWVAAPEAEPGSSAVLRARIHDCNEFGFGCTDVADGEALVTWTASTSHFEPVEIPIPLDEHTWSADRTLELRILVETSSGVPLWVGYDALETPSAIRVGELINTTTTSTTTTSTMPPITTTVPPPGHAPTTTGAPIAATTTAPPTTTSSSTTTPTPSTITTLSTITTSTTSAWRLEALIFDLAPGGGDDERPLMGSTGTVAGRLAASLSDLWPWLVTVGALMAVAVRTARLRERPGV